MEALTLKDVYSNLFYFVRYDSFYTKCTGPGVQGLRVVDIQAMMTLHISVTSHSVCACDFELCVYYIDLFYHSYSAVMPNDMHFLYQK